MSNSENFYFSPKSVLIFKKRYQIWGNWLKNKKVTGKNKLGGGGKHPPLAYRVKRAESTQMIVDKTLDTNRLKPLSVCPCQSEQACSHNLDSKLEKWADPFISLQGAFQ